MFSLQVATVAHWGSSSRPKLNEKHGELIFNKASKNKLMLYCVGMRITIAEGRTYLGPCRVVVEFWLLLLLKLVPVGLGHVLVGFQCSPFKLQQVRTLDALPRTSRAKTMVI